MASIQVSQGFHCVRCSGMPGPRASDFVVINPFIPLLHAQFEGRPSTSSSSGAAAASPTASSGKKAPSAPANHTNAETRVFVWSLRLDESRVPWSVYHSHVVGCHQWQRLEPQSVRGRLANLFPAYHDELVELDANGGGEGGQWSFPAPFLHVSGSEGPLAAMHDRTTWLDQSSPTNDVFGAKLVAAASAASAAVVAPAAAVALSVNAQEPPPKLTSQVLEFWLSNPTVRLPSWASVLAAPSPLDESSAQALRLAKLQRHDANFRNYQQQQAITRKNLAAAKEAAAAEEAAALAAQQDAERAKAAASKAKQAKLEEEERKRAEAAQRKRNDLLAVEGAKAKALAKERDELPSDVVAIAATIKAAYGVDLKPFEVSCGTKLPLISN